MSMRINKFATYLQTHEAHTLIELLDQVRDALMQTYGEEIRHMMQHDTASGTSTVIDEDDIPF